MTTTLDDQALLSFITEQPWSDEAKHAVIAAQAWRERTKRKPIDLPSMERTARIYDCPLYTVQGMEKAKLRSKANGYKIRTAQYCYGCGHNARTLVITPAEPLMLDTKRSGLVKIIPDSKLCFSCLEDLRPCTIDDLHELTPDLNMPTPMITTVKFRKATTMKKAQTKAATAANRKLNETQRKEIESALVTSLAKKPTAKQLNGQVDKAKARAITAAKSNKTFDVKQAAKQLGVSPKRLRVLLRKLEMGTGQGARYELSAKDVRALKQYV